MNTPIMLTPADIWSIFLALCAAITVIGGAGAMLSKLIAKHREPDKKQNERLDNLEKKVESFEKMFDNDNRRLNEIEEGNRVIQQSILALLSHAINGNDTDGLIRARDDLQGYLIHKGGVSNAKQA